MTFREPGGGAYRAEICPACGEDRKGKPWFGKRGDPNRMCERCFTEGKPFPDPVSAPARGSERKTVADGDAMVGDALRGGAEREAEEGRGTAG
jgi:hypothetical protein